MSDLILWGASGHGKVVLDVARAVGGFNTISFVDDAFDEADGKFCDCQVFGAGHYLRLLMGQDCSRYLIWIGK